MLVGCQSSRKVVKPPPYIGMPQEISTYEIKGLSFGSTISFFGVFAETQLKDYAIKNHYRYYVIVTHYLDRGGRPKKITAMMYR